MNRQLLECASPLALSEPSLQQRQSWRIPNSGATRWLQFRSGPKFMRKRERRLSMEPNIFTLPRNRHHCPPRLTAAIRA